MAIRGILFDNDGTLVDTHDLILASMRFATREVLGRVLPDEELMAQVGIPLATQMERFAQGDKAVCDDLLRVYREYNHAHHDEAVRLFPGVAEGLRRLHEAGFSMGVVTSKLHPLAQHGLEITGVWQYLDCLIGPDDCPIGKPQPEPIVMAAGLLCLPPEECIYLGDSPFDMQAGGSAGCRVIAALWGMFEAEVLAAEKPVSACESFDDFVEFAIAQG